MDVNDDADCLRASGAWSTIASKLAPTGGCGVSGQIVLRLLVEQQLQAIYYVHPL